MPFTQLLFNWEHPSGLGVGTTVPAITTIADRMLTATSRRDLYLTLGLNDYADLVAWPFNLPAVDINAANLVQTAARTDGTSQQYPAVFTASAVHGLAGQYCDITILGYDVKFNRVADSEFASGVTSGNLVRPTRYRADPHRVDFGGCRQSSPQGSYAGCVSTGVHGKLHQSPVSFILPPGDTLPIQSGSTRSASLSLSPQPQPSVVMYEPVKMRVFMTSDVLTASVVPVFTPPGTTSVVEYHCPQFEWERDTIALTSGDVKPQQRAICHTFVARPIYTSLVLYLNIEPVTRS
jgi:hypothetical protein